MNQVVEKQGSYFYTTWFNIVHNFKQRFYNRGQPGVNPYRDCAEIVQCQCSCRAVSASSARKSYGARAGIGLRTVPVRELCNATYDMSTGYGLTIFFFKFVKLVAKPNRRGRGARESVRKSHSRLLPPQGGLADAARKGGYGQDTGSVDPSQVKCELGIWRTPIQISTNFHVLKYISSEHFT